MAYLNFERLFSAMLAFCIGFLLSDTVMWLLSLSLWTMSSVLYYKTYFVFVDLFHFVTYVAVWYFTARWYFAASPRGIIPGILAGLFFCCMLLVYVFVLNLFLYGTATFERKFNISLELGSLLFFTVVYGAYRGWRGK